MADNTSKLNLLNFNYYKLLFILCLFDNAATAIGIYTNMYIELNPIMSFFIEIHLIVFILVKFIITIYSCAIFKIYSYIKWVKVISIFIPVLYLSIALYHIKFYIV